MQKSNTKYWFFIIVLIIPLTGCKKDPVNNSEEPFIIVGDVYEPLSYTSDGIYNTQFIIGDSTYRYDKNEGALYSLEPQLNHRVSFNICFINSDKQNSAELILLTPGNNAEDFFKPGNIKIDTLSIAVQNFSDTFIGTNTFLCWKSVNYNNMIFSGSGYILINDTLRSKINPSCYYPPQSIKFRFE